tara:strand:+ start:23 stop:1429 length:1407 start_codon:yes stop_codon:yes gene_type:complete
MARTRVIYQSEAVYVSQDVPYNSGQTGTHPTTAPGLYHNSFNIADLNRVQSANYSFNVTRQDVNQFGELAAIDQCIVEAPTVSFDTSYYLANFTNEYRLGFFVTRSGAGQTVYGQSDSADTKSAITNLIDSTSNAYQKNYYVLTSKEGKDANKNSPTGTPLNASGNYESIIGIGNGFLSSYSSEGAVGGMPTVSISVEGQNMNFISVPDTGDQGSAATPPVGAGFRTTTANGNGFLIGISGETPAVNPVDGTQYRSRMCLPIPTGNSSGESFGTISTLKPGDITLTLAKQTGNNIYGAATGVIGEDGFTAEMRGMEKPDYAGAKIEDAHIQSYNISFDLSRTPIQKLGVKYAFARPVDFPVNVSFSVDAILSDLTSGALSEIINCDAAFDARVSLKDPSCEDFAGSTKPIVCNYVLKGLKLDSQSFSSDIGSNKTVTLDFSTQIGGPSQKSKGIFMSGYHNTGNGVLG